MEANTLKYSHFFCVAFVVIGLFGLTGCKKQEGCTDTDALNYKGSAEKQDGSCNYRLKIEFEHEVGGQELVFNDKDYVNSAGVTYRISRLRYLISGLVLHRSGKPDVRMKKHHLIWISPNNSIEYSNDASNPSISWRPSSSAAPEGKYTGLSFTFGLNSENNRSGSHPDLNQANWAWPEMLGGGYHYMQLEGNYDSSSTAQPAFNMHLGTARDTSGLSTSYINNHFRVNLNRGFSIDAENRTLTIRMDLANWFDPPPGSMDNGNGSVWKLKQRPKAVMPHYDSQRTLNANGRDVFSLAS